MFAAALLVFALGSAACSPKSHPAASERSSPTTTAAVAAPEPAAPLPPPEALTDVLYKLADTSVPGAQKVSLIEAASGDNAAQIDKFGKALQDNQYTPLDFTAENIAWSDTDPGNVTADVTVHSQNPALGGGFTFPMEFRPFQGGWQLSRTTADILLTLGQNPASAPESPPAPAPASPTPTG
ncbi:MAG: hypothetical protein JO044_10580 [Mycobacteriaceae bacterium]|nr:hypothetical protein [Mycobacteriaceae bacterium]MBV9640549.1 hypothetical protein [Mycobacteriaceae bacterium]